MHQYKRLAVWQKSMELVEASYELTKCFPDQEKFGLTSQIRRSVVSVPSNIAEGAGRNTRKDFARFLSISAGSLFELETQVLISKRIGFADDRSVGAILNKISEIHRMLLGLMNSMK